MIRKKSLPFIYDYWLLAIVFALLAFGILMVASASMVISDQQFHMPFHFLFHQVAYVITGGFLAFFVTRIPLMVWERAGPYLLILSLFLLLLVLIPGIGREVNGSMRWLGFGPLGIQVSEFAKFSVIIYLAGYLVRREDEVRVQFSGFIKPMVVLGVVAILLLLEPDFGATAVIMMTALGLMFLSGARLWQFLMLMVLVVGALTLLAVVSPYRLLRLTTFMHPWANQFNSGYQLTQSLIAFGRGGVFGVGLGNSIQKLFYLPEAHTDFLFAVLAEELGLIGELIVIGLFLSLFLKMMSIGRRVWRIGENFAAYLCYGFAMWLVMQAVINIGVNSGVLPTKGLTLPFMSYGGSSMLFNCIAIGIVLRIYHEVVTV
ncbi:MAG: putative lipid II flippase FtsW [Gammaproteobacteria bacterium]|nr:putative lipid II flippase FtsW [Gammaproteobacteria bacterium]